MNQPQKECAKSARQFAVLNHLLPSRLRHLISRISPFPVAICLTFHRCRQSESKQDSSILRLELSKICLAGNECSFEKQTPHCWSRSFTGSADALLRPVADFTASGELHPALKTKYSVVFLLTVYAVCYKNATLNLRK